MDVDTESVVRESHGGKIRDSLLWVDGICPPSFLLMNGSVAGGYVPRGETITYRDNV